MRHVQSRKGLYVHTGGVAWPGSGLEIKDRDKGPDSDKPKLKGWSSPRGWHSTIEEARAAAEVDFLLKGYQLRIMRRGGRA
jgi:hypothetical protein